MRKLIYFNLSIEPYNKIWEIQKKLFELRNKNLISDTLILLEHEPVYTLGKNSDRNHLLINKELLKLKRIDLFEIDRGGDVTFHGPGQLVGYPIIKLDDIYPDIHKYLRDLEELIIRTIAKYNLKGIRDEDFTGVWIEKNKIAAIGVKVSRWITMHGFALNVNTDLRYFENIIPCGIFHKGVTSMAKELIEFPDISEIKSVLVNEFKEIFNYDDIKEYNNVDEYLNSVILDSKGKINER